MKTTKYIPLLLLSLLTAPTQLISAEMPVIFIHPFPKITGVPPLLVARTQNGLSQAIVDEVGDTYSVIDQNALSSLYKQLINIQRSGCPEDVCNRQEEVEEAVNAAEVIAGQITPAANKKFSMTLTNTRRKHNNKPAGIKSTFTIQFYAFQLDYYLVEAARKLLNPRYKISHKRAPLILSGRVNMDDIHIRELEGSVPSILTIKTKDRQVHILRDQLKDLEKEGDDAMDNIDYRPAVSKYVLILETIQKTLREETQKKLAKYTRAVKLRIRNAYSSLYKERVEDVDERVDLVNASLDEKGAVAEWELREILMDYRSVLREYSQLLAKHPDLKITDEELLDTNLTAALEDRIRSTELALFSQQERNADQLYNKKKFGPAKRLYRKIRKNIKFRNKSARRLRYRLANKIKAARKSGKSYLLNSIRNRCNYAETQNLVAYKLQRTKKDHFPNLTEAVLVMEGAYGMLTRDYHEFADKKILNIYDQTVHQINKTWDDVLLPQTRSMRAARQLAKQWRRDQKKNATRITLAGQRSAENFGNAVAMDGDYAIIGASRENNLGESSGSAYIFKRQGGQWERQSKLAASDGFEDDRFGSSVAISGAYAAVGASYDKASGEHSGSVYVFKRQGEKWSRQAKIIPEDGSDFDLFGVSVAVSGDTLIVGAAFDDDLGEDSGSAYIFQREGDSWKQVAKLIANDGRRDDQFGAAVDIDGDTAVVGAFWSDALAEDSGSAYVFTRNRGVWKYEAKLTSADGERLDYFGSAVGVSGRYVAVGAPGNPVDGLLSGSVYVFRQDGNVWNEEFKLAAPDGGDEDRFGETLSIDGGTLLVGSRLDDDQGGNSGSAYIFKRYSRLWTQLTKIIPPDGGARGLFGGAVSVSGKHMLVGSGHDEEEKGRSQSSVYIFR